MCSLFSPPVASYDGRFRLSRREAKRCLWSLRNRLSSLCQPGEEGRSTAVQLRESRNHLVNICIIGSQGHPERTRLP
ncbi:unnamed protein product [Ascophyllum nodosum]